MQIFGMILALLIAILFGLLFPWWSGKPPAMLWPWWLCVLQMTWTLLAPRSLIFLYRPWMKLGRLLNRFTRR